MADYVRLVRDLRLPPTAKLILFALAARADANGICWPSIRTLCDDTGLVRRTIQMHLQTLTQDRVVVREARSGRANVFRLNIPAPTNTTRASARDAPVHDSLSASAPAAPAPRTLCAPGVHDMPITGAGDAPEVTKKYSLKSPLKLRGNRTAAASIVRASAEETRTVRSLRWWTTEAGIIGKGSELGVKARTGESYQDFKNRLFEADRQRQRLLGNRYAVSRASRE